MIVVIDHFDSFVETLGALYCARPDLRGAKSYAKMQQARNSVGTELRKRSFYRRARARPETTGLTLPLLREIAAVMCRFWAFV